MVEFRYPDRRVIPIGVSFNVLILYGSDLNILRTDLRETLSLSNESERLGVKEKDILLLRFL